MNKKQQINEVFKTPELRRQIFSINTTEFINNRKVLFNEVLQEFKKHICNNTRNIVKFIEFKKHSKIALQKIYNKMLNDERDCSKYLYNELIVLSREHRDYWYDPRHNNMYQLDNMKNKNIKTSSYFGDKKYYKNYKHNTEYGDEFPFAVGDDSDSDGEIAYGTIFNIHDEFENI
jgi:hypothetical protein